MIERVVRLGKRGNSRGVNIPMDLITKLGWGPTDLLRLVVTDEGLLLVKAEFKPIVRLRGNQVERAVG